MGVTLNHMNVLGRKASREFEAQTFSDFVLEDLLSTSKQIGRRQEKGRTLRMLYTNLDEQGG